MSAWIQCSNPDCGKWRHLKSIFDLNDLPEIWFCTMNDDPEWNSCEKPEKIESSSILSACLRRPDLGSFQGTPEVSQGWTHPRRHPPPEPQSFLPQQNFPQAYGDFSVAGPVLVPGVLPWQPTALPSIGTVVGHGGTSETPESRPSPTPPEPEKKKRRKVSDMKPRYAPDGGEESETNEDRLLPCGVCGREFMAYPPKGGTLRIWKLREHVTLHFQGSVWKCPLCEFQSKNKQNIYLHLTKSRKHGERGIGEKPELAVAWTDYVKEFKEVAPRCFPDQAPLMNVQ